MKNFLQNLLMFFALCLCGLISYQWVRETDSRKKIQELRNGLHDKSEAILNLEANSRRDRDEIQRLDAERKRLDQLVKSNIAQITWLSRNLDKATNDLNNAEQNVLRYKDVFLRTSNNLALANERIAEQNTNMVKMANDAKEVVQKYKDLFGK